MGGAEYKETAGGGQQKFHKVRYADGTEGEMTQAEWRERDKSAGIVRIEEDGSTSDADLPEADGSEDETQG